MSRVRSVRPSAKALGSLRRHERYRTVTNQGFGAEMIDESCGLHGQERLCRRYSKDCDTYEPEYGTFESHVRDATERRPAVRPLQPPQPRLQRPVFGHGSALRPILLLVKPMQAGPVRIEDPEALINSRTA